MRVSGQAENLDVCDERFIPVLHHLLNCLELKLVVKLELEADVVKIHKGC